MAIQISKAIILHIPKTGGSWIRGYLNETDMNHHCKDIELAHISGEALRQIIGYTEDLVCCFIRHPLTWYISYWETKQRIPDRRGGYLDTIVDLPFHEFLHNIIKYYPGYLTEFFNGYIERCRFIGKQENLRDDLENLFTYLRIPYNKEYLHRRPDENVISSEQKFTLGEALAIMEAEKEIIKGYDYNYIPLRAIENV